MSKALIVDDHPFIRATVKHLLQLEGFVEIFQAGDGADAMQLAREQRPELIILDLAMPKLGIGGHQPDQGVGLAVQDSGADLLPGGIFFYPLHAFRCDGVCRQDR